MTCDITVAASSTAASALRRPVRTENASAPSANSPSVSANANEYSPASELTSVPPMIRWLNWIAVCAADALAPVAMPLKKRKQTVAIALSSGPGRRMRIPRANA